jgi:hypothetical protein
MKVHQKLLFKCHLHTSGRNSHLPLGDRGDAIDPVDSAPATALSGRQPLLCAQNTALRGHRERCWRVPPPPSLAGLSAAPDELCRRASRAARSKLGMCRAASWRSTNCWSAVRGVVRRASERREMRDTAGAVSRPHRAVSRDNPATAAVGGEGKLPPGTGL